MYRIAMCITLILGLMSVFISCETETPKLKLSRAEKTIVDSVYRQSVPVLRAELDSMCAIYRAQEYQRAKDSIISIRLSEIEQILPE